MFYKITLVGLEYKRLRKTNTYPLKEEFKISDHFSLYMGIIGFYEYYLTLKMRFPYRLITFH